MHSFLELNPLPPKPRTTGYTEVRGPYYRAIGPSAIDDLLAIADDHVDSLKIPAPSVALLPEATLRTIIARCHRDMVTVGAGGLIERVLVGGPTAVQEYFAFLVDVGFDAVEISAGMLALSTSDFLRLVEHAADRGLTVKAEVGIQFGAGGTSSESSLDSAGVLPVGAAISRAKGALDAGASMIVLESEGVTESVEAWRTDVPAAFVDELGLESLLFEAADPPVFEWYVKVFGPAVNLFIDSSQVLHLAALRTGAWGPAELWGRVASFQPSDERI